MSDFRKFARERKDNIKLMSANIGLKSLAVKLFAEATNHKYSYNFDWLGLPIIQWPQDIVAMQELIWKAKPDLIIETGVARGGSIAFYASMLELLGRGRVIGIDIDIRKHNRQKIRTHPFYKRITLLQGSSTDPKVLEKVKKIAAASQRVLVCLDSNHTHNHVLRELELYAPLVSKSSYIVVFDTVVEHLPTSLFNGKPWSRGNNPKTAVAQFLKYNHNFVSDNDIENKLIITTSPAGYLKRIG